MCGELAIEFLYGQLPDKPKSLDSGKVGLRLVETGLGMLHRSDL